jgi:transcriptional regulator with XRE-family HTH domain
MAIQKTNYGDMFQKSAALVTESEVEPGQNRREGRGSRKTDAKPQGKNAPAVDITKMVQLTDQKLVELKKVFGKNLARIRKEAGYSQLALSIEIDMTHNFINELEQGDKGASFLTLVKLEVVLRTPVYKFFEPVEKPSAANPNDFQYPDVIDKLLDHLRESLDTWNDERLK